MSFKFGNIPWNKGTHIAPPKPFLVGRKKTGYTFGKKEKHPMWKGGISALMRKL